MEFTFLAANQRLTKSYSLDANKKIVKRNYPLVSRFTSYKEQGTTITDLFKLIVPHAMNGHCLLKGNTITDLVDESRAGSTDSYATTMWLTLDLDKAPYKTVEEALDAFHVLNGITGLPEESPFKDVSYIVQYSASHGMPESKGLNCHIFMLIDEEIAAPYLKSWLIQINMKAPSIVNGLKLNEAGTHFSFPLDITTCQNDKLLFVAPPEISKDLEKQLNKSANKFKESERYQLVIKKFAALPRKRIPTVDPETARAMVNALKNKKRKEEGKPALRSTIKYDGDKAIIHGGVARITSDIRIANGHVTFNVNNGDSWSYHHPVDNYKYIGCFKHPDDYFETEKFLPEYFARLERERKAAQSMPTEEGETLLAFSDRESSTYWRGTWNPVTSKLDINVARSAAMLNDWVMQYGREKLDYVPTLSLKFLPHEDFIVDLPNLRINTYLPTPWMVKDYTGLSSKASPSKLFPLIDRIMRHAVSNGEDDELYEYWLNWWAVKYQTRNKVITSWLLRGVEGTGKNVIMEEIIQPTMGVNYAQVRLASELEQVYNGDWLEKTFIVLFDEIEVSALREGAKIQQILRSLMTNGEVTVRHMHRQSFNVRNYTSFIFTSNKNEALPLAAGDRRYNIGVFQHAKLYPDDVPLNWDTEKAKIKAELPAWMAYIMTRKADANMASNSIKNEARQQLIDVSRTSLEDVSIHLQNGNIHYFLGMMPDMKLHAELHGLGDVHTEHYADIVKREIATVLRESNKNSSGIWECSSKLTREELYSIFSYTVGNVPYSAAKFTSFMRHRGIHIAPIKINGVSVRGITVLWTTTQAQYDEFTTWYASTLFVNRVTTIIGKARLEQ